MAGSTLAYRQDPMAAVADFGDQLAEAWQSLNQAAGVLVRTSQKTLLDLAEQPVTLLKPHADTAAAWLNDAQRQTLRVVDDSVAFGLRKLGIPTHADYVALTERLDRLSASVKRLETGAVQLHRAPRAQTARRRAR